MAVQNLGNCGWADFTQSESKNSTKLIYLRIAKSDIFTMRKKISFQNHAETEPKNFADAKKNQW